MLEGYLWLYAYLLTAVAVYGALLAIACFAPRGHGRFLIFISSAAMICLLLCIPLDLCLSSYGSFASFVCSALPALAFLASFYQFFIKGYNRGIAAAAIGLQVLGMFFILCHWDRVALFWAA